MKATSGQIQFLRGHISALMVTVDQSRLTQIRDNEVLLTSTMWGMFGRANSQSQGALSAGLYSTGLDDRNIETMLREIFRSMGFAVETRADQVVRCKSSGIHC